MKLSPSKSFHLANFRLSTLKLDLVTAFIRPKA